MRLDLRPQEKEELINLLEECLKKGIGNYDILLRIRNRIAPTNNLLTMSRNIRGMKIK